MSLSLTVEIGLGVLFVLAFGNGANDVGKSIAHLLTDPETSTFKSSRGALVWGGLFSGLGSVAAIIISVRLFSAFEPQSFLQSAPGINFILAAIAGAASWIFIATILKIQVSTTHAIVGAIIIQAIYVLGVSSLQWDFVLVRVLLPLAAGPFAALIGVHILSRLSRKKTEGPENELDSKPAKVGMADWGSAAGVAFARGVNDAPKMAALGAFLLLGTSEDAVWIPYLVVTVAVVIGSLVWGDRVARELIGKTPVHRGHRLRAHAATAVLVSAGAYFGDAFSTTHVSDGAAAGHQGKKGKRFLGPALKGMLMAWLVTLPMAGILAIVASMVGVRVWG